MVGCEATCWLQKLYIYGAMPRDCIPPGTYCNKSMCLIRIRYLGQVKNYAIESRCLLLTGAVHP